MKAGVTGMVKWVYDKLHASQLTIAFSHRIIRSLLALQPTHGDEAAD